MAENTELNNTTPPARGTVALDSDLAAFFNAVLTAHQAPEVIPDGGPADEKDRFMTAAGRLYLLPSPEMAVKVAVAALRLYLKYRKLF